MTTTRHSPTAHPTEPASPGPPESLARSLNNVGWRLFAHAAKGDHNVVLSPLSIGVALGMLDAGASGEMTAALRRLYGAGWAGENRVEAFAELAHAVLSEPTALPEVVDTFDPFVAATEPPTVRLANRIYHDVSVAPESMYRDVLRYGFDAGVERLVMAQDPTGAAARINEWVAARTNNLIPHLLAEDALSADSQLALVNALYFKATWLNDFDPENTEDRPFTPLDGPAYDVPLMHQWEVHAPAASQDGFQAVELEYADSDLSMLVVLPDYGRYAEVESGLGPNLIDRIDAGLETRAIELWLPRFTSDARLDVGEAIEDGLGVAGIVGPPGLDGFGPGVTVDSIQHAATVIVDERSTEAAAATSVDAVATGIPEPVELVPFRADRPFIYAIRERSTGAVLFVGRVLNPQS